jgi:hypothetical protein
MDHRDGRATWDGLLRRPERMGRGFAVILLGAALLEACGGGGRSRIDPATVNEIKVGMTLGDVIRIIEAHGGSRSPRSFDTHWDAKRPDQDAELMRKGKIVHLLLPDDTCISAQVVLTKDEPAEEDGARVLAFEMGTLGAGFPGAVQWNFDSEMGKHASPTSINLLEHEPR